MILLIDNYDSFSYNLYQMVGEVLEEAGSSEDLKVIRNDAMTVDEIEALHPDGIIISPGPGKPRDAGVCEDVVKALGDHIPILGVCLGEQGICEALGAEVTYAKKLMHGKQSMTQIDTTSPLFQGLPDKVPVARYHSLAVNAQTLPKELKVIGTADDGEVMAVQHTQYDIYGVQFHPESIMTPDGRQMLQNFIEIVRNHKA